MRQACLLLILAWNSRADLRSRRIPLKENLLFCLVGLLWTVAADRQWLPRWLEWQLVPDCLV